MFLVDKYYNDSNYITCHQTIIDKIIDSFDAHNQIYSNIDSVIKLPTDEFGKIIYDLEYGTWRYANFQHLIVYGPSGCGKEYLVNKLLEKIYGKNSVELKEVEYTVSGYSNTKTKIMIKQSKHHIIIEPNSNGFDKYLIQEIIQDYAKSELLNILKHRKLFKVVVINKIDNLSYYAQASLRRTMEKYSSTCKFILISDQLSKIIEPLRSRCLMIRVPLPSNEQILETLLHICQKENISIKYEKLAEIIYNSENKVNHAIWLLEMYKYGIKYEKNWEFVIDSISDTIVDPSIQNNKKLYTVIKKIREQFYILFITNVPTQLIIRKIMTKLISKIQDLKLKYHIIDITSIFEQRLSQGTRHIIHMEAYIARLIFLFTSHYKGTEYNYNLDVLEI
jgi:replication factor C subunit 3/5